MGDSAVTGSAFILVHRHVIPCASGLLFAGVDDDPDNLIPFPASASFDENAREAEKDAIPVREGYGRGHCLHDRTTVYENARELVCRDCGAVLDPVDFLVRLARVRAHEVSRVQRLRAEERRLLERVDDLKREERNAKGRLRTAERRLARLPDERKLA